MTDDIDKGRDLSEAFAELCKALGAPPDTVFKWMVGDAIADNVRDLEQRQAELARMDACGVDFVYALNGDFKQSREKVEQRLDRLVLRIEFLELVKAAISEAQNAQFAAAVRDYFRGNKPTT